METSDTRATEHQHISECEDHSVTLAFLGLVTSIP